MSASPAEIEALARKVWDTAPNEAMSARCRGELRFGAHGSKSLRLDTGQWFDHERNIGGGFFALYKLANGKYPEPNGHDPVGALAFRVPAAMARDLGHLAGWWDYHGAKGETVGRVIRFQPAGREKEYRQCRPTEKGWAWKMDGLKLPLYRLPDLLRAPAATVYLTEGEKAADALRGLGLTATTNPGGAGKFTAIHATALSGRAVVLLPDNDEPGRLHEAKTCEALDKVGARVRVVYLPNLPPKGDAVEWIEAGGTAEQLAELVARARDNGPGRGADHARRPKELANANTPAPPDPSADDDNAVVLPDGYMLDERGLFFQPPPTEDRTAKPIFVSGPFEVIGECRSLRSAEWGLLISWRDRDGAGHRLAIPKSRAHKEDSELFAQLEGEGLTCATTRAGHSHFRRFLVTVRTNRRIRNVARAGWHRADDGWAFMLPNGDVVGVAADAMVLQAENNTLAEGYDGSGSLADWQYHVARPAVGNDLLGMSISTAFAPPLIDISAGQQNYMIHIFGVSQSGKTTVQRIAISVWGVNSETSKGTLLRSWRSTSNGIEGAAAECNDLLMALGELGEVSGKDAAAITYMIGNGSAKSRATRSGGARQRETFRLMGLSTGEVRLASKLAEDRLSETAGQEVRFLEIRADGGAGRGVFQQLHGYTSGGIFAEGISASLGKFHGTAGREFLARLVADRNADAARLADWIEDQVRAFLVANLGDSKASAVRSAARRFGLVAAAGELAIAYGVLPWPPGEAARAVGACFARWIEGRPSGTEAFEDGAAIRAVRSFIESHGENRFTWINDPDPPKFERPTANRAGWREYVNNVGWRYLILPEAWRTEVCKGLDPIHVARVLADKGLLECTGKNLTIHAPTSADEARPTVYAVKGAILS